MKAHKYWSLGALFCMTGSFYTGYRKFMKAKMQMMSAKLQVSQKL